MVTIMALCNVQTSLEDKESPQANYGKQSIVNIVRCYREVRNRIIFEIVCLHRIENRY